MSKRLLHGGDCENHNSASRAFSCAGKRNRPRLFIVKNRDVQNDRAGLEGAENDAGTNRADEA